MRAFFRFMMYLSEFDLAIGLSTGRGKQFIAVDRANVQSWRDSIDYLDLQGE